MRLFVAALPPGEVVAALAGLRVGGDLRKVRSEQLHVTLLFLGEVEAAEPLVEALAAASLPAAVAVAGPAVVRLGRAVLCVPVAGLDDLATAVAGATGHRHDRPYRGHVTLARARGRDVVPRSATGQPFDRRWPVREVALVRSDLGAEGYRYATLAAFSTGGA